MSPQELQERWQELLRSEGKEDSYKFAFVCSARYLGVVMGDGASYDRLALHKMQGRLPAVASMGTGAARALTLAS
eukprot:5272218-Amphidinium_carterae.1